MKKGINENSYMPLNNFNTKHYKFTAPGAPIKQKNTKKHDSTAHKNSLQPQPPKNGNGPNGNVGIPSSRSSAGIIFFLERV